MAEREIERQRRLEKPRNSSVAFLPHTWIVPAAPRGAPPPPLALVERGAPLLQLGVLQGIRGQVADLQGGEFAQEVVESHPGSQTNRPRLNSISFFQTKAGACFSADSDKKELTRTRRLRCGFVGGFSRSDLHCPTLWSCRKEQEITRSSGKKQEITRAVQENIGKRLATLGSCQKNGPLLHYYGSTHKAKSTPKLNKTQLSSWILMTQRPLRSINSEL